jgi:hypothetical protein
MADFVPSDTPRRRLIRNIGYWRLYLREVSYMKKRVEEARHCLEQEILGRNVHFIKSSLIEDMSTSIKARDKIIRDSVDEHKAHYLTALNYQSETLREILTNLEPEEALPTVKSLLKKTYLRLTDRDPEKGTQTEGDQDSD